MTAVTAIQNPVLRLRAIDALVAPNQALRTVRKTTIGELTYESWSWREVGSEIQTSPERAWRIGNGS
jgi:hypothetical protein